MRKIPWTPPKIPTYLKHIINNFTQEQISDIIFKLGNEKNAQFISEKIISCRKKNVIDSTRHLVDILSPAIHKNYSKSRIHFATKTFQALRIHVNKELESLCSMLHKIPNVLNINGSIIVLSFHSLEDKLVKNIFRSILKNRKKSAFVKITKDIIIPSDFEVLKNPRARSAKLRAIKKIP